jgi:hypothetical protein
MEGVLGIHCGNSPAWGQAASGARKNGAGGPVKPPWQAIMVADVEKTDHLAILRRFCAARNGGLDFAAPCAMLRAGGDNNADHSQRYACPDAVCIALNCGKFHAQNDV